jgi:hypothetical protein
MKTIKVYGHEYLQGNVYYATLSAISYDGNFRVILDEFPKIQNLDSNIKIFEFDSCGRFWFPLENGAFNVSALLTLDKNDLEKLFIEINNKEENK